MKKRGAVFSKLVQSVSRASFIFACCVVAASVLTLSSNSAFGDRGCAEGMTKRKQRFTCPPAPAVKSEPYCLIRARTSPDKGEVLDETLRESDHGAVFLGCTCYSALQRAPLQPGCFRPVDLTAGEQQATGTTAAECTYPKSKTVVIDFGNEKEEFVLTKKSAPFIDERYLPTNGRRLRFGKLVYTRSSDDKKKWEELNHNVCMQYPGNIAQCNEICSHGVPPVEKEVDCCQGVVAEEGM